MPILIRRSVDNVVVVVVDDSSTVKYGRSVSSCTIAASTGKNNNTKMNKFTFSFVLLCFSFFMGIANLFDGSWGFASRLIEAIRHSSLLLLLLFCW